MSPHLISEFITLPVDEFCEKTGLGETLVREWIKDGRLKAFRAGKKRLLVVVQTYLDLVQKQMREGVPEYDVTRKAREVQQQKREERKARLEPKVKPKAERPVVDLHELELL